MKILVLNDTRSENHHGCSRVMNAIDRNLFVRGFKDICYFKLMLRWDLDEDSKRKLLQTDLLIINGEGTLHGNLPHVQSLLNVIKFAKSYGVTVALINATLFNLSQESITKLGEVDYLFVRDKASMKLMELNDIKTFYCPDLALWDPFPIREKVPRSGSAMSDGHGSLRLISREEMKKEGMTFISVNNIEQNYYQSSKIRKIINIFKQIFNVNSLNGQVTKTTHIDFLKLLNTFELVITGRYHIVCMCILTETPFKFFESNTPKISFLLKDIGIDVDKFHEDLTILRLSKKSNKTNSTKFDFSSSDLIKIRKFNSEGQILISKMFDHILSFGTNK
ncbi:polysaccharide pyruvyl transferase family protein [Methylophilaceae bacterium]|nr:polysaccharide pyruvyl transferase family protein [Methylophilaceae bacterium]